jgi:hypothetical protein
LRLQCRQLAGEPRDLGLRLLALRGCGCGLLADERLRFLVQTGD